MESRTLITPPIYEPVSVSQVKDHLRITNTAEDHMIMPWIKSARDYVEDGTGIKLLSQVWDIGYDCFYPVIRLPFSPVSAVGSITYIATDGTETTLSSTLYQTDLASEPARIAPAYGESWPVVRTQTLNPVTIRATFGYADPTAVPKQLREAVLKIIGDFYDNREESLIMQTYKAPVSAQRIIDSYRLDFF